MKRLRVALLLFLLAVAAAATYVPQWRARQWQVPLPVDIYPINGDGAAATDDYCLDENKRHDLSRRRYI